MTMYVPPAVAKEPPAWNCPLPRLRRIVTSLLARFAIARSGFPSPVTSARFTHSGAVPLGKDPDEAGLQVPGNGNATGAVRLTVAGFDHTTACVLGPAIDAGLSTRTCVVGLGLNTNICIVGLPPSAGTIMMALLTSK